jgi:hypothetical protein
MKFVYRLKIDLTHLISNRANCQEARPAAVANLVAYGADCVEKPDVNARALPRRETHQPPRPHGASDLKPGRDGNCELSARRRRARGSSSSRSAANAAKKIVKRF